jgi:hypothetical protein
MAKRKLSVAQRAALRKAIRKQLAAGTPQAEVLRSMAGKYSVSPETVRWYLKSAGNGSASHAKPAKRGASRKTPSKNGHVPGLLGLVRTVSENGLKRALAAKRLFPRLDAQLARRLELLRVVKKAKSTLRRVESRAKKLRRKIARLISG